MNMKKISFGFFQVALMLLVCFTTTSFAAPIVLKSTTSANPGGFPYRALEDMATYIEKNSNGKYKMEIFGSSKLGGPDTIMQGVQFGTIHFASDGTNNMNAFTPMFSVFDLPFVFKKDGDFEKLFYGPFGEDLKKRASSKTIRYLAFHRCDFRKMFLKPEAKNLDELRKMRIRTTLSKTHSESVRAIGLTPVSMATPETYTAIQQGVIDGLDLDLTWGVNLNFQDITPNIYESDHLYTPQVLATGERWWSSLSADDRKMFEGAVKVFNERADFYFVEEMKVAREKLVKAGVKFTKPTDADVKRMLESVQPLYNSLPADQKALLKEIQAYF